MKVKKGILVHAPKIVDPEFQVVNQNKSKVMTDACSFLNNQSVGTVSCHNSPIACHSLPIISIYFQSNSNIIQYESDLFYSIFSLLLRSLSGWCTIQKEESQSRFGCEVCANRHRLTI